MNITFPWIYKFAVYLNCIFYWWKLKQCEKVKWVSVSDYWAHIPLNLTFSVKLYLKQKYYMSIYFSGVAHYKSAAWEFSIFTREVRVTRSSFKWAAKIFTHDYCRVNFSLHLFIMLNCYLYYRGQVCPFITLMSFCE